MDSFSNILKQRLGATQSALTTHPATDTLVAFVERGLNGSERESVLAHISVCPECREAVALGTPEVAAANTQAATVSLSRALQFPAAMRWASLAAALAVAVGVGVIAYEHEPRQQLATSVVVHEKEAVPRPTVAISGNELPTSKDEQSSVAKSVAPASPAKTAARNFETRRAAALAKKETEPQNGVVGGLTATASPRADRHNFSHANTLPSAPEAQPTLADKRDVVAPVEAIPAVPLARAAIVPDNKIGQDTSGRGPDGYIASKSTVLAAEARSGALAGTTLLERETAPTKTVNSVSVSGSGAKAKLSYGMRSFVHWTISAAGQLQRRAVDGTLTIVEPVRGAIIRAVAAEGIEVWAGGSQTPPSPKNVHPRSVLFHSSDAGETWKTIDGPWQGSIERVNLAGFNSLTVVTTDGTWSTGDGGSSWSKP